MYRGRRNIIIILYSLIVLNVVRLSASIVVEDVVNRNKKEGETVLSPDDFAHIPAKEIDLTKLGIKVKSDPTMGDKVEGDMILLDPRHPEKSNSRLQRSAIRQTYRRWPSGEIPYTISTQYGSYSRSVIAKGMDEFHHKTCLKFIPRDSKKHRDYLYIFPDDGCYSLVGRSGGRQTLSLDSGCIQTGTVVHELMHASGFYHEQSRSDRDEYIEVVWENILNGAEDQFEKYGRNIIDNLGEPYDYSSIMHYGPYAFSGNGRRTIVALKSGSSRMGQRDGFSDEDIKKLNILYKCPVDTRPKESGPESIKEKPSTKKPDENCEDTDWRCKFWSLSIFSYCEKYEELAEVKCRKSCGKCQSSKTAIVTSKPSTEDKDCRDNNPSCASWSRHGFCNSFMQQNFMRSLCAKSCGFCNEKQINAKKCEDDASYLTCKVAYLINDCDSQKSLCKKTCGLC